MTATPKGKAKKAAKLDTREVPLSVLHENPWNPNKQTERAFEAERESIEAFGFIDPITVRPHPELEGEFQIVDGAHRYRALTELERETASVIVLDLDDAQAKKLTIILNETRGQADRVELAHLLAEIQQEVGDDLRTGLPYDELELDTLLDLVNVDWETQLAGQGAPKEREDDTVWTSIELRVPEDVAAMWINAKGRVEQAGPLHADEAIANGQVAEALLAEFLAGPSA